MMASTRPRASHRDKQTREVYHTQLPRPRNGEAKASDISPVPELKRGSGQLLAKRTNLNMPMHLFLVTREGIMSPAAVMVCVLALLFTLVSTSAYGAEMKSDSGANEVERIFKNVTDSQSPGAAILVRENGKTSFRRGYGVRDLRRRTAIDSQTNFRLASCTKQFTAMAVMLLVHDGKMRYDERLTDVFPEFPDYGKAITLRNLLNHTSGLPDYEDLMDQTSQGYSRWSAKRQIQDAEVLLLLERQESGKFRPGSQWSYSNSGYVMLGLAVAKVAGQPFEDFLEARIFAPLKMDHTLAYVKGKNEVPDRAYGHSKEGKTFVETDQSATSATLGDGGVYSNLEDLARWDDALAHHTLLTTSEMQPALTPVNLSDGSLPQSASGPGDTNPQSTNFVSYGFGWFLDDYRGHHRMWHYGETTGFKTAIERFQDSNLTVIVLSNRSDLDPATLALKAADAYWSTPK
jgi:CubicO group peptidase (beta-lactamase class C family)